MQYAATTIFMSTCCDGGSAAPSESCVPGRPANPGCSGWKTGWGGMESGRDCGREVLSFLRLQQRSDFP